MRYDKIVSFVHITTEYNPQTGNNDETAEAVEVYANVMDTTEQRMQVLYGGFKNGAYTVIIQNNVNIPVSYIAIDGEKYQVDRIRRLKQTTTYFVSGGS